MGFWIFMFLCALLIPGLMLLSGHVMWKHPGKANWIFGYRTTRSTKNPQTWHFANTYCGKLWWKLGKWMLIVSALVMLPFLGAGEDLISLVGGAAVSVQTVIMLLSIYPTEKALKKNFDQNGNPIL